MSASDSLKGINPDTWQLLIGFWGRAQETSQHGTIGYARAWFCAFALMITWHVSSYDWLKIEWDTWQFLISGMDPGWHVAAYDSLEIRLHAEIIAREQTRAYVGDSGWSGQARGSHAARRPARQVGPTRAPSRVKAKSLRPFALVGCDEHARIWAVDSLIGRSTFGEWYLVRGLLSCAELKLLLIVFSPTNKFQFTF